MAARQSVAYSAPLVFALLTGIAAAQDTSQRVTPDMTIGVQAPPAEAIIIVSDAPRPPMPAAPVLPADARALVDQVTTALIQQLQTLQDAHVANGRPDDAANVRSQMQLLRQVTGLPTDLVRRVDLVSMAAYRDRVGQTFQFTITGSVDAPVWGSSIYTDDTRLEGAAVHAGVLRSGQTGPVRVTVLAGQPKYTGSKRNGIESGSFGAHPGSYRIETGSGSASRPTSVASFRGRFDETFTMPVVGSATGSVWGSDIYTDDSSLGGAAVHAGLLRSGEFGFVNVTILGGQTRYAGVARNGVTSREYAEWQGSFRLAPAPQPWILRLPADVVDTTGLISMTALRNTPGVSFSMMVVGAAGPVRGSDIYTDDSSIAAAAVHAGLLRPGESGYVQITVLPGQQNYAASEQNGIRSGSAGQWPGSFRLDRGSGGSRE